MPELVIWQKKLEEAPSGSWGSLCAGEAEESRDGAVDNIINTHHRYEDSSDGIEEAPGHNQRMVQSQSDPGE